MQLFTAMDKEYYILKPAVGTKETGMAYPAVVSYPDYDFDGPRSVYKIDSRHFADFEPDLNYKLSRGSKICDLMSQIGISAVGLLINEKMLNLLTTFNLVPYKFYHANIEMTQSKNKIQYYFIHFVWNEGVKFIDYINSEFDISEFGNITHNVKISSCEELVTKQNEIGRFKMISFTKTKYFSSPFDLFINPINLKIIMTERLRQKLIDEEISGLNIEQI